MKKTIKLDQQEKIINQFYISDNALLQYREISNTEISAVIRYVESSCIKEAILYTIDPTKKKYLIDISEDKTTIAILEKVDKKVFLRRIYSLEENAFEIDDFIDLVYNRKFKNHVDYQRVLKKN